MQVLNKYRVLRTPEYLVWARGGVITNQQMTKKEFWTGTKPE